MTSQAVGQSGEREAAEYLKKKGYRILEKNYSKNFLGGPKMAEIDIIVRKKTGFLGLGEGEIVFVEVKTLSARQEGFSPEQKIDRAKIQKISRLAEIWLTEKKIKENIPWRIDALAVTGSGENAKIQHFENI